MHTFRPLDCNSKWYTGLYVHQCWFQPLPLIHLFVISLFTDRCEVISSDPFRPYQNRSGITLQIELGVIRRQHFIPLTVSPISMCTSVHILENFQIPTIKFPVALGTVPLGLFLTSHGIRQSTTTACKEINLVTY